jgi:hypothetical protein
MRNREALRRSFFSEGETLWTRYGDALRQFPVDFGFEIIRFSASVSSISANSPMLSVPTGKAEKMRSWAWDESLGIGQFQSGTPKSAIQHAPQFQMTEISGASHFCKGEAKFGGGLHVL